MQEVQPGLFLEKLAGRHVRQLTAFDCGHEDTNAFIRNAAFAYQNENLGRTYRLVNSEGQIHAFVTIAMSVLKFKDEELALNLGSLDKPSQIPALRIARLGTSSKIQGKGIGSRALDSITGIFQSLQHHVGSRVIAVDAVSERVQWYAKRGFKSVYSDVTGRTTVPMYFMPPRDGQS